MSLVGLATGFSKLVLALLVTASGAASSGSRDPFAGDACSAVTIACDLDDDAAFDRGSTSSMSETNGVVEKSWAAAWNEE